MYCDKLPMAMIILLWYFLMAALNSAIYLYHLRKKKDKCKTNFTRKQIQGFSLGGGVVKGWYRLLGPERILA